MERLEAPPYADILRRGFAEYRDFVNPLIHQRAALTGEPIEVVRAEDGHPVLRDGTPIEELHGTQTFGHHPPSVAAAMQAWLQSDALNWYPSRVNPFVGRLARRLCERTGYENVYFGCTGSDAVEAALKLARARGRGHRALSLTGAYHGCTMGSLSLMQSGPFRDHFAPHLPGSEGIEFNDIAALEAAFAQGDVGVVIAEPIQIEGGVRPLSEAYIEALCHLTAKHGALLVADEVQTGLGRAGRHFIESAHWPRRPDVVLLGKGLGGGLVPVSAMLTTRATFLEAYGADFARGESHNSTFSFNGLTAVAALATLDLIDDAFIARCAQVGDVFRDALRRHCGDSKLVVDIRGRGLMVGVQLADSDHPWLSFEHFGYPQLAGQSVMAPLLSHRLYPRGFFCFSCGHDWRVLRLQPRQAIPFETLERFAQVCREELDHLEALL
ncbi:MAG: aminotransferase class III-fold pyridoxal phosphate-dependent enzyme [Myxococcales bacterium]|nr:aminotransferase class III-fold pyridoxal phosphate-dependent enzyme [Myxococcales bacterium]